MSVFEYTDEISLSEISKACLSGDIETVKGMLLAGKCPFVRDNQGRTSIHFAAKKGHLECCELLLNHKDTDVNSTSFDGVSPVMMAASTGNLDLVKMFVSMGADTELMDSTGSSCLDQALSANDFKMFEYLLTVTNPNIRSFEGWTISHTCARDDNHHFLHLLRNDRRCRFTPTDFGVTPLHLACQEGNIECAILLAEYEPALINHKAEDGATAILLAAQNGHPEVVQYMIDMGADVDIITKDGTVIHSAVLGGCPECLEILLTNGADPNGAPEKTSLVDSPISQATFFNDERCVGILLEYGALGYKEYETVGCAVQNFLMLPYSTSIEDLENYSASETLRALACVLRSTPDLLSKALEEECYNIDRDQDGQRQMISPPIVNHLYNIICIVKWPLCELITSTFVNKLICKSHVGALAMLINKNYRFSHKVVLSNLIRYMKYPTSEGTDTQRYIIHLIHRALFDQQVRVPKKFRDFKMAVVMRYNYDYISPMDGSKRDLLTQVDKYSKTPRPLLDLCRFRIRGMICWTFDADVVIGQLDIPEVYKEILLFERKSLVSPSYLRALSQKESPGL